MGVAPGSSSRGVVATVATRVRRYSESIVEGHSLGIPPGPLDQLWSLEYHRAVVQTYGSSLPWEYLLDLGRVFGDCADEMDAIGPPSDTEAEWQLFQKFLRSMRTAVVEAAPRGQFEPGSASKPLDSSTPSTMAFGELARWASREGALEMVRIARAVEQTVTASACPLNDMELMWLGCLRDGHRVADIAFAHGYSERSMYRALADLQARLGVSNRTSAVAHAAAHGWI